MADSKHTAGPWGVGKALNLLVFSQNGLVANCGDEAKENLSGEVCAANARLIAAAPDLLEALRDCYLSMRAVGLNLQLFADIDGRVDPKSEFLMKQSELARAALAKAEGRS